MTLLGAFNVAYVSQLFVIKLFYKIGFPGSCGVVDGVGEGNWGSGTGCMVILWRGKLFQHLVLAGGNAVIYVKVFFNDSAKHWVIGNNIIAT